MTPGGEGTGRRRGLSIGAVLVVGGGIAGIQSALDLADSGYKVYMVESSSGIGGWMSKLDKTFPTNDCSMCILAPKLVATGRHQNVTIFTNSMVEEVMGREGNFKVRITEWPRYVDEDKCTGCGLCTMVCPMEFPNEYEEGMTKRRAIHIKYAQTVPLIANIDRDVCIGCRLCEQVCVAEAINFQQEPIRKELNVGSIIVATGFEAFDPRIKSEYGYGHYRNVVSSTEFERLLSATGPFLGHVLRPSDGRVPKKIAFIQCVGSRDVSEGSSKYCSGVCCMYALKEAIIAKEHIPDLEPTMFYMDFRAFGKEFEDYRLRARDEHAIRFLRSGVSGIEQTPDHDLVLSYVEDGRPRTEVFDLVVLSVGLRPPKDIGKLASVMGLKLDENGFVRTGDFSPMSTNVPGIFVTGAVTAPKDIPDTVAQSSGAAAMAMASIPEVRGTLEVVKEYPEEMHISPGDTPRIGVFICHCGINIGATVRVPEVVEYAKTLPNVAYAEPNLYTCSVDTQLKMVEKIKEHHLNRVVVASCTPRTHEPLFQNTLRDAGLNPYLFEMANIREHCSWVHMKDRERATEKAKDLVRMAVQKATRLVPLKRKRLEVRPEALVIGGGLSGMTAALGLAAQGYRAHLVEREKELGGNLRRVRFLPGGEDPQQRLSELVSRVEGNALISIHRGARIDAITGYVGNFRTTIDVHGEEKVLEHGVVIITTGAEEYRPGEYHYDEDPRVLSQLELEEVLAKGGFKADTLVMVQCVGSRCDEFSNCSRICCTEAVKNALVVKDKSPSTEVFILHKDVSTYGFREAWYREARGRGIHFVHFDEDDGPTVSLEEIGLKVEVTDRTIERRLVIRPDLVVLSTGIRPHPSNVDLAKMVKVPLSKDGFFLEAHMKLRPVDFATDGIFLAGLAHGPKFLDESISQAMGAVARACTILSKEYLEVEDSGSRVDQDLCRGCGTCVSLCVHGAMALDPETQKATVNEFLCKGCGMCSAGCPERAIDMKYFTNEQIEAQIRALVHKGGGSDG